MPSTVDKKLGALTIVMVVSVGALGWWCYQLYAGNVAQDEALGDLQRTMSQEIQRLESRVATQDDMLETLSNQVAQANDGGLRRLQQLESQVNDIGSQIDEVSAQVSDLDGQISEIRGSFWQPYSNRDMGQLDDDVGTLETEVQQINQCVDSIVQVANGSGSFVYC